ncbi:MAG: flagellar basal body P-ring formation chaperone FlgA, partial [Armatimonadetes bacterium]|nr:flagellar basal body P-ring formation chaperone FlgA [Armatimonadota bacterium]
KTFAQSGVSLTGTVLIEVRHLPADQIVPAGNPELRVKAGCRSPRKGQNSIPVEIVVDGQVCRTVMVSVMVRVVAPVLIATKTISKSEPISLVNTALQERDITTLSSDVLFEAPNADWTASVPISEGAVVRGQWVAAPAAVKSGDSVLVVVESGGVRVTEKGTAVQDGRLGERIKVRFTGDVREARGTVVEPGVVKISIGRGTSK